MGTKPITSTMLDRLRAVDPSDPGSAQVLVDIVIALDEGKLNAEEAEAVFAEIDRLTRAINRRHVARG